MVGGEKPISIYSRKLYVFFLQLFGVFQLGVFIHFKEDTKL